MYEGWEGLQGKYKSLPLAISRTTAATSPPAQKALPFPYNQNLPMAGLCISNKRNQQCASIVKYQEQVDTITWEFKYSNS